MLLPRRAAMTIDLPGGTGGNRQSQHRQHTRSTMISRGEHSGLRQADAGRRDSRRSTMRRDDGRKTFGPVTRCLE